MAITLSPNLKLKIDDALTDDSKYNLWQIDSLGAVVSPTATGGSNLKSSGNILIQPNSSDLGGSGAGGVVSIGEDGTNITTFDIYAQTIDFNNASAENLAINANLIADGSVSNEEFQYLDGATSNLQAQINALGGANQVAEDWVDGDGLIKVITHNWGTRNVLVQILDNNDDYSTIEVVNVSRPNDNQVTLESSELPGGTWTVLLTQVGV